MDSSLSKILAVAAALGVSATFLLLLIRKLKEEEFDIKSVKPSRQSTLKIRVPARCVGAVIGRQGATIKQLQEMTNTKINFADETEEDHRVVIVRGLPKHTEEAEKLISKIIVDQPVIETYEMFIPHFACGEIIGRKGETIRFLCHASQTKIFIDHGPFRINKDALRRVTIKGSVSQIEIAKEMLEEKLAEIEMRHKESNPDDPRFHKKSPMSLTYEVDETQPYKRDELVTEKLLPTASDGFLEVFVSAIKDPDYFWVQTCGTHAKDLDKLVEDLTECYSHPNAPNVYKLEEVEVGDIVAAPFRHDKSWYRAKVMSIEEDSYSNDEKLISVYYVDFGDSDDLMLKELCRLEKRFLYLPFQAIACSLAYIRPVGNEWSEEAIQLFEQLTYIAQWKLIMARPVSSEEQEEKEKTAFVELVDTNGSSEVNIAEQLVQNGHALWTRNVQDEVRS